MRILLISTYNFINSFYSIVSFLEKHGHDVFMKQLKYPNKEEIIKLAKTVNPSIVGLTCLTVGVRKVIKVARDFKQLFPEIKIVLGNIHATVFYEKILKEFPFINFIVIGEGEVPMKELLEHLSRKRQIEDVHNIAYRNEKGSVIKNRVLKELPQLDDLLDIPKNHITKELICKQFTIWKLGRRKSVNVAQIETSRGCPYDCNFCAQKVMSHRKWRAQSPEKVVDKIEQIYRTYNIHNFLITDPCFAIDKERVKNICTEINRRNLKINWCFEAHPNHVEEELIHYIKKAGCAGFTIGINCLTDSTMYKYRKIKIDYTRLINVIKLAKKVNLWIKVHIMCCFPEESFKDLFNVAKRIRKLKPTRLGIHPLRIYPGTELYKEALKKGIINEFYWMDNRNPEVYPGSYLKRYGKIQSNIREFCYVLIIMSIFLIHCRNIRGFLYTCRLVFYNGAKTLINDMGNLFSKILS